MIIWNVRPEIFEGFHFLRWYGACWVLGAFFGQWIMLRIYRSEGISVAEVEKLTLNMMLAAIIGARLGHILFYDLVYYLDNPAEILPIRIKPTFEFTGFAGLASHGGMLGAFAALYVYNRKYPRGYLWLLDRLTIAGAALGGFIRLGNLMNSEMIGTPSDVPWAFVFARVDQVPRHPSQLYEALSYLLVFVSLYLLWRSRVFYGANGFIFGLGVTLIFSLRFVIEFFKEDQVAFEGHLPLNMGQILSIPLVIAGIVLMKHAYRKGRPENKSRV